jgi:hypothetical protein
MVRVKMGEENGIYCANGHSDLIEPDRRAPTDVE